MVGIVFGSVSGKPAQVSGARIPREGTSRAARVAVAMGPSLGESFGEFCGESDVGVPSFTLFGSHNRVNLEEGFGADFVLGVFEEAVAHDAAVPVDAAEDGGELTVGSAPDAIVANVLDLFRDVGSSGVFELVVDDGPVFGV